MSCCRLSRGIAVLLVAFAALLSSPAVAMTLNQPQELPTLVEEARRAALVEVASVRYGLDERGLHATWLTAEVLDPLFGDDLPAAGGTLSIKIYGAPVPVEDGSRMFLDGTPRYAVGQRWLLLLNGTSEWGFTSTVGLHQGAFVVSGADAAEGAAQARSLAGNRRVLGRHGLGKWLAPSDVGPDAARHLEPTDGPVPYRLLRRTILEMRGAPQSRPRRGRAEVLR